MRLRACLLVAAFLVAPPAFAQNPPSTPDEPDEPKTSAPETKAPEASTPETKAPATSKPAAKSPTGTIIVAVGEGGPAARALARRAYQDVALRPAIDEATAAVLTGGPAPEGDEALAELAATVASLAAVDETVRRRLATSIARELGAERVVLVEKTEAGPRARVVEDDRYLAVVLTAEQTDAGLDWSDAVAMLRGLSAKTPPPGPRKPSPPPPPAAVPLPAVPTVPPPDDGDGDGDDVDLLTNPWFWSGLGVVISVGVTVLVLSQTALNEPDVVMLEGRVGP